MFHTYIVGNAYIFAFLRNIIEEKIKQTFEEKNLKKWKFISEGKTQINHFQTIDQKPMVNFTNVFCARFSYEFSPSWNITWRLKFVRKTHAKNVDEIDIKNVDEIDTLCQFHQCFTSSFYVCRPQKRKKDTDDFVVFLRLFWDLRT